MITALTLATDFANALPWPEKVSVQTGGDNDLLETASAATFSFIGSGSAQLSVALNDSTPLDAAAGLPGGTSTVLRSAAETATKALGSGVVTTLSEDGPFIHTDNDELFVLVAGGTTIGVVSVRLQNQRSSSSAPLSDLGGKMRRINEVEMALTVVVGNTRMSVRDVLSLEPGGVIELDRSAGAPADVLLNGRLIAHGEVVVVDQDYAVRITKILDVGEGFN